MRLKTKCLLLLAAVGVESAFGAAPFVNSYESDLYGHPTKNSDYSLPNDSYSLSTDKAPIEEPIKKKMIAPAEIPMAIERPSENAHKLRFSVLASYTTVDGIQTSNGSEGIMNSSLYPAFKLDYTFITPGWNFYVLAGRKTITFENSVDRTIITPTHTLYRFDLMAAKKIGDLAIGAGAGIEDKFFYKIVNTSFADSDTSKGKKIYLFSDYQFFQVMDYRGTVNVKGGYNPKEDNGPYTIQAGNFYSGSLKLDHVLTPRKSIGVELYFKAENYKTQQLKIQSTEVGLGVSFSLDWGAGR